MQISGGCTDDSNYAKNCVTFKWACTDSRYPWFRNKCKKTCNVPCWGKNIRTSHGYVHNQNEVTWAYSFILKRFVFFSIGLYQEEKSIHLLFSFSNNIQQNILNKFQAYHFRICLICMLQRSIWKFIAPTTIKTKCFYLIHCSLMKIYIKDTFLTSFLPTYYFNKDIIITYVFKNVRMLNM